MGSIPIINLIAILHLTFVATFVGLLLCEALIETYGYYKKDFSHSAIRFHYLLDMWVELPLITGILVTGIALAVLVGKFSGLHLALIICGSIAALFCPFLFITYVRIRNREINKDTPDEKFLDAKIKGQGTLTLLIFQPAFTAALAIGAWLAYQRVLESMI